MSGLIARRLYAARSMSGCWLKAILAPVLVGMVMLSGASGTLAAARADPAASQLIKIAVFNFELQDNSAAAGVIPSDEKDGSYLKQATEEAKRLLSESGRFSVIDTSAVSERDLASCERCEAPLAQKLGGERAMIGLITRVNRTEYTLQIRVIDAATKETISNDFTGLRMGANYAWSRGVTWLMKNQILARASK